MTITATEALHTTSTPAWRGINHLALVTTNMDATVRFYHGVLGARLVATVGTPAFRHYFFEFGPGCTVAFFEYVDSAIEPFAKPAGVPDSRAAQFDHLALDLPDEDALRALRERLDERRLRGHRDRRTSQRPLRVLHRSQRDRPRGVVLGARRDRAARHLRRRSLLRRSEPGSRRRRAASDREPHQPPDHAAFVDPSHD